MSQLPHNIESQLSDLETRHKLHQRMLFDHHEAKHDRREAHKRRKFTRKPIPILL